MDPALPPVITKALGAIISQAWAALQRRRLEEGREVLARRIARGKPWALTEDETAAAMWTYMRAVQEGVAKRNLELLADALVTSSDEGVFLPDEFRRRTAMLADLSREEIYVIAAFIRVRSPEGQDPQSDGGRKSREWSAVQEWLLRETRLFGDEHDVTAHTASLLRTGLVVPWSGFDAATGFASSPRIDALARMVDFDAALERDREESQ